MKQTEIGFIPDDWEVKNFKEVTNRITVGIANFATHAYTDHGIIMFRNQNIKENTLDLKDLIYIKKDFAQRYSNKQLYENDLLIARTGYPGTTCVVPKEFEGCQTFTTLIATPKSDVINSDYIAYYFNSDFGKKLFSAAQIGGAQKNVNAHTLSNIKICIPPLSEQQRIAKVLSDVDALISTTEKLIQKKKNIKQGTMQNLLTGKKRLPGFGPQTKSPDYKQTELGPIPGDWEVKRIIDICDNYSYGVGAEAIKYDGRNQYIRITDIDDESRAFIPNPVTSPSYISEKCYVNNGDILIARTGNSVGKSYHYSPQDGKLIFAGFLMRIHVNSANSKYVFYNTLTTRYNNWICSESMRSGQPGINLEQIKQYIIALPPEEEQTAIATVLSSMDKEIETLNTKLEKYRNLKTAMMQQLLTGKIRLR